ncbi:MAG: hypothetical protein HY400_05010, partial [Elusimicrobia bacterium]|nr:hypothetical protein [Elusimicrobiota bacterium]
MQKPSSKFEVLSFRSFLFSFLLITFHTSLIASVSWAAFVPKNRPYDVGHYAIDMKLDVLSGRFNNSVVIRFRPNISLHQIELDCVGLRVKAVKNLPGNENLRFRVNSASGTLIVLFPLDQPKGKDLEISVEYSGQAGLQHEGFFRVADPDDPARLPLFFTMFEPTSARRFFPSNDEPYDKATSEVTVEIDSRYDVLSNGRKLSDKLFRGKKGASLHRVHWTQEKPQSTYLLTIAMGQFGVLKDSIDGVPLEIYMAPGKESRARFAMDVLKHSTVFLKDFYGIAYPWPRYGMVGIPGFLWGGMENTTLTSMRESAMTLEDPSARLQKFRIAMVVAHELAHQWFG